MTKDLSTSLASSITSRLEEQFNSERKPTLRLSQMGPKCPKALWHSIHTPEEAEPLPPWAEEKFAFGNIIEALAISQAKAAGHRVEGEQDVVYVDGIAGHRDCIIDGCIVDIKSTSSRGFSKFKDGTLAQADSFGYLDQLDGYLVGSLEDPLVTVKDKAYLWAIHKELGHMCLYEHRIRESSIRNRIRNYKAITSQLHAPVCTCETRADGQSGNVQLSFTASYSAYKFCCFPNLRTFLYADGPRYLTKVVRRPMNKNGPIVEVDKYGKIVYH